MNPISPKVSASLLAGIVVSAILGNIATVDPAMLAWFGPWSPFIYGTTVSVLSGVAGYLVRDPLRDLGAVHVEAGTPYPVIAGPAALPLTAPPTGPRHLAGDS